MAELQAEITRYNYLPKAIKVISLSLISISIVMFIAYMFNWSWQGKILTSIPYYYLLYAILLPCVFFLIPARKKDRQRCPWHDVGIAALLFGIFVYFALNSWEIGHGNWVSNPSMTNLVLANIIAIAALESARRITGYVFLVIVVLFAIYPLIAGYMPGIFWGFSVPYEWLMGSFAFGSLGVLGLPAQLIGTLLLGFLIFAGLLMASGAGEFFLDFATSLLGRFRGGPAKVSIISSALMGTMTGVPHANVIATGTFTIPAMIRTGYPAHYAAAVEAVASTGGIIMPPIMGLIAFIMVVLTGIPYGKIIVAAAIPAFLYYFGLMMQVDAYAAKTGLKGLPREEIPSLRKTLRQGWQFIFVLAFLVFGLIYMRWSASAPIYASALLIVLSFTHRRTMLTPRKFVGFLVTTGGLIVFVVALAAPIAFVLQGIYLPGTLTAVTTYIMSLSEANTVLILVTTAALCYIMGMVGVALVPYIVLAVTTLPALAAATGMSVMALHLFTIFWFTTSFITPPVGIAYWLAAAIARAPVWKTGITAMRLAVVIYFVPFFFVFNPALVFDGPIIETIYLFILCLVGIWILASGLEGYLHWVGKLKWQVRPLLIVGGFLIALPGWEATIAGFSLTGIALAVIFIRRRTLAKEPG